MRSAFYTEASGDWICRGCSVVYSWRYTPPLTRGGVKLCGKACEEAYEREIQSLASECFECPICRVQHPRRYSRPAYLSRRKVCSITCEEEDDRRFRAGIPVPPLPLSSFPNREEEVRERFANLDFD